MPKNEAVINPCNVWMWVMQFPPLNELHIGCYYAWRLYASTVAALHKTLMHAWHAWLTVYLLML